MRSRSSFGLSYKKWLVLLFGCIAVCIVATAQNTERSSNESALSSTPASSTSATKEEVNQLRNELRAQRQTIEELKALVEKLAAQKLAAARPEDETGTIATQIPSTSTSETSVAAVETKLRPVSAPAPAIDAPRASSPRLMNAVLVQPAPAPEAVMAEQTAVAAAPKNNTPLTAGWNGEHFFIRSPDGQFSISPYGYVNTDYRAYKGDGAPADTFILRQARFGFQGSYGSHFDFALLSDAAATTGSVVRDVYLNIRLRPEFQFQAGQFKVPYAQETGIGDTSLDFVERGFQSMLYPSAAYAYRSPGVALHGDIYGGALQYWVGAFNGKGYALANTTNQPEVIGRLRLYPWRNSKSEWFKQLAIGGSIDFARSRGLSGDQSFSGLLPDNAYTFFPQFAINGPIERYNGEFTYLKSRFALRGEYDQLNQFRQNVGSEQPGGLGFITLPGITGRAWDLSTTYLITGEKRPENGTPRVSRPLFGPDTPGGQGRGWGAWELALRYTGIQGKEPGSSLLNYYTPGYVAPFNDQTDEFTFGLNWYPNYWVKYVLNVGIDQLKNPSVTGAEPQNYFVVLQRLQFRF